MALFAVGARGIKYPNLIRLPPSDLCEGAPSPQPEARECVGEPHLYSPSWLVHFLARNHNGEELRVGLKGKEKIPCPCRGGTEQL